MNLNNILALICLIIVTIYYKLVTKTNASFNTNSILKRFLYAILQIYTYVFVQNTVKKCFVEYNLY